MAVDASTFLAGPRGRHLCLAVAHRLHQPVGRAWTEAAWRPGDAARRDALRAALREVDASPAARWDDLFALVDPMDGTVSAAMGWQEPHDEDVVAADPTLLPLLEPIAAALGRAPATQWWATGLDLATVRYADRYDEQSPAAAAGPETTGIGERLAQLRAEEDEGERRARAERPDDPRAAWSGHWWSTPTPAALPTTRALAEVGSVNLLWEEDSFGQWDALVWGLHPVRSPRVFEIDGAEAWVELVRRYPLDVTWSRRQDWYRVTGTDSTWLIPDWQAVGRDFDAVHLSVLGYLNAATRRLQVGPGAATVLAGWDPDQTWWLTDILAPPTTAEHWRTDQEAGDVLHGWHLVT
ncbi:hypothetical protein [Amnibacterium endophyticum]|uniref:Uncharacterized protein n=1 Tax=Amnibacterium endophyticum TaxID=2109337 RepID=A0ABW4LJT5_9MICO